jgi:hypothetical protein
MMDSYITYPHVGCSLAATGLSSGVAALPLCAKRPARRIDLTPTPRRKAHRTPRLRRKGDAGDSAFPEGTGRARRPAHCHPSAPVRSTRLFGGDHVQARRQTARSARTPNRGHESLQAFRGGPKQAAPPHRHRAQTVADRGKRKPQAKRKRLHGLLLLTAGARPRQGTQLRVSSVDPDSHEGSCSARATIDQAVASGLPAS